MGQEEGEKDTPKTDIPPELEDLKHWAGPGSEFCLRFMCEQEQVRLLKQRCLEKFCPDSLRERSCCL